MSAIESYYEARLPSRQTIADLFRDKWTCQLPDGLISGESPRFSESRVDWAVGHLAGGIEGRTVLELGPFEGYQTYLLSRAGARTFAVEGNSHNFVKCLCVKEIYQLDDAHFALGDVQTFLRENESHFDVGWAAGILYHLQEPADFLRDLSRAVSEMYIWTHYFDAEVMGNLANGQERHFRPALDRRGRVDGFEIDLHARSYLVANYGESVPERWEGGQEDLTYWMTRDQILGLVEHLGMEIVAVGADEEVNGLPCFDFVARRA